MARLLEFAARFGTEERCIEHLAGLRWPDGFVCSGCGGRQAWRLQARARVYECGACHRQELVTAGTVFHRTRTDLSKWFLAAYLMGRDKRGVSAKFLQRELAVAYQTAWTMLHKLRHGLSEARPLRGFLEADETFIGGRGDPTSRGRSTNNPDKSLVVAAVEKVPAPKNRKGKHRHAVKRQHGFFAGNARIAVLPAATGAALGAFLTGNVAAGSHLLTDGFAGYRGRDAALDEHLKHTPVIQDGGANAGAFFPIIHTLFGRSGGRDQPGPPGLAVAGFAFGAGIGFWGGQRAQPVISDASGRGRQRVLESFFDPGHDCSPGHVQGRPGPGRRWT